MTLRLFVLQAHYRKPLDFTAEALQAAASGWEGLNAALGVGDRHGELLGWTSAPGDSEAQDRPLDPGLAALQERFCAAMDDDLNSSAALGELFDLARPLRSLANRLRVGDTAGQTDQALAPRWRLLVELAGVLGLEQEVAADAMTGPGSQPEAATIEALIEERRQAKANRDFSRADAIRAQLQEAGIELVDKPGGVTIWLPKA